MEPIITLKNKTVNELKHEMDKKLIENKKCKFILQVNSIAFNDLIQLKKYPIIDIIGHIPTNEKTTLAMNLLSIKKADHEIAKETILARKERLLSLIHFIIFIFSLSYILYQW